eukprot:scaffold38177_cov17-Tisochrysis_lutea.AAC.3
MELASCTHVWYPQLKQQHTKLLHDSSGLTVTNTNFAASSRSANPRKLYSITGSEGHGLGCPKTCICLKAVARLTRYGASLSIAGKIYAFLSCNLFDQIKCTFVGLWATCMRSKAVPLLTRLGACTWPRVATTCSRTQYYLIHKTELWCRVIESLAS